MFTSSEMSPARKPGAMTSAAQSALRRLAADGGQAIREERLRRRWSLRELAERAGVALATLHSVEAGEVASLESYARIGAALGLRPSLEFADSRARPRSPDGEDLVHATMGEFWARVLQQPGVRVSIDEPYQHYQFAGRADVLAWDEENLLHIENRTRFPNVQEAAGSYNAKRQYLAPSIARRLNLGPHGWRSVTHVMACLWSSEVIHAIRIRPATFDALCPDPTEPVSAWLVGERPVQPGVTSSLVLLDPALPPGSRRRALVGGEAVARVLPRYRGYADAAEAVRMTQRGRVTKTPQPR
jgi:transcriptional regulator with XRE-family HTH domain